MHGIEMLMKDFACQVNVSVAKEEMITSLEDLNGLV